MGSVEIASRLSSWLERRVKDRCEELGISMGEASLSTGNSRGYLSKLFKERSDIGVSRFSRICTVLGIKVDASVFAISRNAVPTMDEISEMAVTGICDRDLEPFLPWLVIYAAPTCAQSDPRLLYMGRNSLAAKVLSAKDPATLQQSVNKFPKAAREKLAASYLVASQGTCLVTVERLAAHMHGQPSQEELVYRRLLFPVATFRGEKAVGLYAVPVSSWARLRTSSINE